MQQKAVARALQESPDIALARIDEQKAALNVRVAKDPFSAKVGMGSGIAYTNGYPLSIDGSGPSIIQARASQYIFNKAPKLPGGSGQGERSAGPSLLPARKATRWRFVWFRSTSTPTVPAV